jgi:hypothetical protein
LTLVRKLARAELGQNLLVECRERRGMAEEAGFRVEQLLEQTLTLAVGRLQAAHEIGHGIEAPGFEIFADFCAEKILRRGEKNAGLALEQQAKLREFVLKHEIEGHPLPPAGPVEIETCTHFSQKSAPFSGAHVFERQID